MAMQVSTYHPLENDAETLSGQMPSRGAITSTREITRGSASKRNGALQPSEDSGVADVTVAEAGNAKNRVSLVKRRHSLSPSERRNLIAKRHGMLAKHPFWDARAVEKARLAAARAAGITLPYASTPLAVGPMKEWLKRLGISSQAYAEWSGGTVGDFFRGNPDWSLRDWVSLVLEYRDVMVEHREQIGGLSR